MEQKEGSHRQDAACVRCRDRKVRCGRERPACLNCKNDNSECEYSVPEKRVNHTKLLCRNFDRLEDRLGSIEGELSWLTAILKTGGFQQSLPNVGISESIHETVTLFENSRSNGTTSESTANRRIVQGQDGLGDQYHGPGTLLSLCYELKEAIISKGQCVQATEENHALSPRTVPTNDNIVEPVEENITSARDDKPNMLILTKVHTELLERLCFVASFEPPLDVLEHVSIRLPPKQLLLMVLPQFFSQVDYSTDVFVESYLIANIESIYSRPPMPTNDPWAICFNTIILLVLGSESSNNGSDPLMGSQFSQPFFHAMRAALHQARLLTTPKLINVQALALLSIAAQRYYPCSRAGAIFAQACLLAKLTGLHQACVIPADTTEDEVQERYKTFMSLHLRDKLLSLSWHSICWLPSFDCSLSLQLSPSMFADPRITSRIHLAEIQERLYRCMSMQTRQGSAQATSDIADICRNLDGWASSLGTHTLPFSSFQEAELQLSFLATRMLAYSHKLGGIYEGVILDDARASCFILLISYEKHDKTMVAALESLCRTSTVLRKSTLSVENEAVDNASKAPTTGRLSSLLDAFPVIAFFVLAQHILRFRYSDGISTNEARASTEFKLLQAVHDCFADVNSQTRSDNRASQIERTFGHVLELIELLRYPSLGQTPSDGTNAQSSHMWTPDISSLGSRAGDLPATTTSTNIDMSWDFLTSPFGDPMMDLGDQEEGRGSRKRPRTTDLSLSNEGDSLGTFLTKDWNSIEI